ncbi:MAG: hypothetical protein ACREHV_01005 [Rhizomicrobium sp.]
MAIAAALALAGCATAAQEQLAWVRADGQPIAGNPALLQQYQLDHTACEGEMQKANLSGQTFCPGGAIACAINDVERQRSMLAVGKGCMANRGYLQMPASASNAPTDIPIAER